MGEAAWKIENTDGFNIRNNIIYDFGDASKNRSYVQQSGTNTNLTVSHNNVFVTNGVDPSGGAFPNDVFMQDPLFIDLVGNDFHLQDGSPSIDAGVTIASVVDDFGDSLRTGTYDIGAYEFGGASPPPPPPPISDNTDSTRWYFNNILTLGAKDGTSWGDAWRDKDDITWAELTGGSDTLYLSGGADGDSVIYDEQLDIQADSIFVLRGVDAGHLGLVVFSGTATDAGILITAEEEVFIFDIIVRDAGIEFSAASDNGTVLGCVVLSDVSARGGFHLLSSDSILIQDCIVTTNDAAGIRDGIFSSGCSGNTYRNNVITIKNATTASRGIYIESSNDAYIINNTITQDNSQTGSRCIDFNVTDGDSNLVLNNILYAPNSTNRILIFEANPPAIAYIYGNIVYGASASGAAIINVEFSPNSVVKNNIMQATASNAVTFRYTGDSISVNNVDYNIHFSPSATDLIHNRGTVQTWAEWQTLGYEANGVNDNPDITTIGTDWSLQSVSPAIDVGLDLGTLYNFDYSNAARPQGSAWDMGALEFFGGVDRTSWFVDNTASGANNGHGWVDAYQGFTDIDWTQVTPKDTIYFSGGVLSKTYDDTLVVPGTVDGTADSIIVLQPGLLSPHNGTVIFQGPDDSTDFSVNLAGTTHLKFDNFTLQRGYINLASTTNDSIVNCALTTWNRGILVQTQGGSNFIKGNTIVVEADAVSDAVAIFANSDTDTLYIHQNTVMTKGGGNGEKGIRLDVSESLHLDIRQNTFEIDETGNQTGISYCISSIGNSDYISIVNNSFDGTTHGDTLVAVSGTSGTTDTLLCYLNTFIGGDVNLSTSAFQDISAKNNIFFTKLADELAIRIAVNPDSGDYDSNMYYNDALDIKVVQVGASTITFSEWKILDQEGDGINANPFFDDRDGARAYSLSDSSFAIDAGIALASEFALDIDGVVRPQLDAWDMGAQEATEKAAVALALVEEDYIGRARRFKRLSEPNKR